MEIRKYRLEDEMGWVHCRVLSFLDTAYFDNVLREKEKYNNPSIELVAVINNQIVGLLDIEYETEERTVCSRGTGIGGMMWHLAVHPDFRRKGIGKKLFSEAERICKEIGLNRIEAWTRDDQWVMKWYEYNQFEKVNSYLHVYLNGGEELKVALNTEIPNFYPVQAFVHYVGEDREMIKRQFKRVHECHCYVKQLL